MQDGTTIQRECYERWLARRMAEAKFDKLSRMADPARNDNPHERAVANTKLALLRFKLYGAQPEPYIYKYGLWEKIKDWWMESCGGVIAVFFWIGLYGILYLTSLHRLDPSPEPQPTTEERIKAERLSKIDAAMEALQNERDEIEPPPEPEPPDVDYP
jgi:hypothetical protein